METLSGKHIKKDKTTDFTSNENTKNITKLEEINNKKVDNEELIQSTTNIDISTLEENKTTDTLDKIVVRHNIVEEELIDFDADNKSEKINDDEDTIKIKKDNKPSKALNKISNVLTFIVLFIIVALIAVSIYFSLK